jgi:hypothetical protein
MPVIRRRSKRLDALLDTPAEVRFKCGILEMQGAQKHGEDEFTIAALGEIHEFGLGVPVRSFVRAWFDARLPEIRRLLVDTTVRAGGDLARVAPLIALKLEAMQKNWINEKVNLQENAASTQARKGSDVPLVDTGVLRASITAVAEVTP